MTPGDSAILLVEDSPADVELTLHELSKNHVAGQVEVTRDGEEALDFLFCRGVHNTRTFEKPVRLVLLDLKLPGLDGLEVLRQAKSDTRTKAIPVVILTSSKEESDVVSSYLLGANSYIQKPMDLNQFDQMVKQLGLYWLTLNQPPPPAAFLTP